MPIKPKNIGSPKSASKGDLEDLREDLQGDMQNMEDRLVQEMEAIVEASEQRIEKQMQASEKRMLHHFDASVEYIHQDVARANDAEISLHADKLKEHEIDIKTIKHHIGIA
jgi:Skp family chaperone for outer membrane proteins